MKFALHARSLLNSSDGYYRNLLEHILRYEEDWACLIPCDLTAIEQKSVTERLESSHAGKSWNRWTDEDLSENIAVVSLSFPGVDDSIYSKLAPSSTRLIAYNPADDDERTSHLEALIRWNVDAILSPALLEDLPFRTTKAQENFFRQRHLYLAPSIEIDATQHKLKKSRNTLFLVKHEARNRQSHWEQYPDNWPWRYNFNTCVNHWIPALQQFDVHVLQPGEDYDESIIELIAQSRCVVVISDDGPYCQTIAKAAYASQTPWTILAGPNVSPLGFLRSGLPVNLSELPSPEKSKLRTFFQPILNVQQINETLLEPEILERSINASRPVNQIEQIRKAAEKLANSSLPLETLFPKDDPLYPEVALPNENTELLETWRPLRDAILSKGLNIPGLESLPYIHTLDSSQAPLVCLERFAKGLLIAESPTSGNWLPHFAECVRHYPEFTNCCETVLSQWGETHLQSFFASGDSWATTIAHRIFTPHQRNLHSRDFDKSLGKAASSAGKLIQHDIHRSRTYEHSFFYLLLWTICSGDLEQALQEAENAKNTSMDSLAQIPQTVCFLSTTRFRRHAAPLLDLLSDDEIKSIQGSGRILNAGVACALNGRSAVAQYMLELLYNEMPDILITPKAEITFDPDIHFAPLYQSIGQTQLADNLFERACCTRPYLAAHKKLFFSRIPPNHGLQCPDFTKPTEFKNNYKIE